LQNKTKTDTRAISTSTLGT